jgi:hypothetical protein
MTASQNDPFVFEKEAFAMSARQRAAQCRCLGDGKDERVGRGAMGDPQRVEPPEQVFGCQRGRRHGPTMPSAIAAGNPGEAPAVPAALATGRSRGGACKEAMCRYHACPITGRW